MKSRIFNVKNILFLLVAGVIIGFLCGSAAEAQTFQSTGSPGDTAYGTVITAEGTDLEIRYQDSVGHDLDPVTGNTIEVTVLDIYGFSMALLEDKVLYVNEAATNESAITNEGNASDAITVTFEADFANAGPGTWTVNIRRSSDDSLIGTLTSGNPSTTETLSPGLPEDADWGYYHEVIAPSTDGTPGAYVVITTSASTTNEPTGQYTGANGLTYGGLGASSESTTYELLKPLMTLTRTSTVDAPRIYDSLTNATHYDPVPGAIITYTLAYSNAGNSSAEGVVLVNKVPSQEGIFQTHLAHFNVSGETTNVTIEAGQGTATGWTIRYSTLDNPSKAYGDTADWSGGNGGLVGTINNATSDFFPPSETYYITDGNTVEAKWVKWEKQYVSSTESGTLTFGVTIR